MSGAPFFAPSRWADEYRWHGDMLADTRRNRAYAEAIELWVVDAAAAARRGEVDGDRPLPPVVLEIGTGSGLLSSLVARAVAQHWPASLPPPELFAVEVVPSLHRVARQTFAGLPPPPAPPVALLPRAHSLDLPAAWLPPRGARLVVGELLDSGLLGEGLVASMRDAKQRLTAPGFAALPARGRVLAVPCEGLLAYRLGGLRADGESPPPESPGDNGNGGEGGERSEETTGRQQRTGYSGGPNGGGPVAFRAPRACRHCAGSAAAEGMHVWWGGRAELGCGASPGALGSLAETPGLPRRWGGGACGGPHGGGGGGAHADGLWPLAPPQEVLDMDFADPPLQGRREVVFTCAKAGTVHALVYWWRVDMLRTPSTPRAAAAVGGAVAETGGAVGADAATDGGGWGSGPFMSTAPGDTAGPDHWRQNVVPLPRPLKVVAGAKLVMMACHDADMVWFEGLEVLPAEVLPPAAEEGERLPGGSGSVGGGSSGGNGSGVSDGSSSGLGPPVCGCGLHATHSRGRLAALNDPKRRRVLAAAADRAAAAWAGHAETQQQQTQPQLKPPEKEQQQQPNKLEEAEEKDDEEEEAPSSTLHAPTGLALVLGDGPLLPFLLAARGFRVLVADRVGRRNLSPNGGGGDDDDASPFGVRRWLTERCLEEAGLGGQVAFADAGEDEDEEEEEENEAREDASIGGVAAALRRAVARELARMRRSNSRSSSSGGSNSNNGSGSSTVGFAGVFAEPFFPSLDEPGGGGDGWGFDSMLALRKALQAFPRRDGQSPSSGSSSDGIDEEGAQDSKRQRTAECHGRSNGSGISGAARAPVLSLSPVGPLVLSPARAVLRGALVQCRALWDSLRPLAPEDLEGLHNLGPAFAFKAAGPADDAAAADADDGKDGNGDGSGSGDEKARAAAGAGAMGQGAGGATGLRGPFLRRAATGDVAADALPFNLAQWPTAEVVAGPVDLLRVDLRALGPPQRQRAHQTSNGDELGLKTALEHTAWLRPGRPGKGGNAVFDAAASATRSGNDDDEEEGAHQGPERMEALRPEQQPQEEAHVLAVWVDYDLGGAEDLGGSDGDAARWLAHGPGVWHGRQGVLALAAPLALTTAGAALALRTCLTAAGRLTIEPAA